MCVFRHRAACVLVFLVAVACCLWNGQPYRGPRMRVSIQCVLAACVHLINRFGLSRGIDICSENRNLTDDIIMNVLVETFRCS